MGQCCSWSGYIYIRNGGKMVSDGEGKNCITGANQPNSTLTIPTTTTTITIGHFPCPTWHSLFTSNSLFPL